MKLILDQWASAEEMIAMLESLPDKAVYGDVYARFLKTENLRNTANEKCQPN